ncbi:hypothetical protein E2C01_090542 [Portunus trituberculatus]|uniref:Uncharacterized protein n=1 Tax=Portunus trituberculatus TaxID=210409 RepID=A0A5B7JL49_PORTR|nr:hypothetical protein [Portunus trituberculatus]
MQATFAQVKLEYLIIILQSVMEERREGCLILKCFPLPCLSGGARECLEPRGRGWRERREGGDGKGERGWARRDKRERLTKIKKKNCEKILF